MNPPAPESTAGDLRRGNRNGDEEREARACLMRAAEPVTPGLLILVAQVGAEEALDYVRTGRPTGGDTDLDVEGMRSRIDSATGRRDLDVAASVGARLVIPGDAEWPPQLDNLERLGLGCLGLYVRGSISLAALAERSVAVVGTRAASEYGMFVARSLGEGLATRGWGVVSGLAFGIDSAAHSGAVIAGAAGAGTLAVLACGIDSVYPKANAGLMQRVLDVGLVVSESSPAAAPQRHRFLVRNRLIAALSAGTVVVEAAARSGARSTARYAGALGRAVMAVPGPVTAVTSVGCHQLLRDDPATVLVTCVDDVVEAVGEMGDLSPRASGPTRRRDALPALLQRILDAVPVTRPAPVERIAATAGVSVPRVAEALAALAAADHVATHDGLWSLSPRERADRKADKDQEMLDLDW